MKLSLLAAMILSAAGFAAEPAGASEPLVANAAQAGDQESLRDLLGRKADANIAQPDGTTALHWAVYRDDLEAARLLLKAGADSKAANRYGVTPISLASTNGNAEMATLLLDSGADPNAALPGGETPLMTAARTGKVAVVRALLSKGADVNAKETSHKQTALMWAAAEGHAETVEILIQAGADVHARVATGFTPFLFAARHGRIEVARLLLKAGVDVNELSQPAGNAPRTLKPAPRAGTSALHIAVTNAHYEFAAMLLDAGANPNASGPGFTPLHVIPSVRKPGGGDNDPAPDGSGNMNSLEFVRKLAAIGGDLNARTTRKVGFGMTSLNTLGATAFLLAARTGDAELMRLLASLGADPLIPNADGATPLIVAAGLGTRSPGEDAGTESEVVEAVQAALDLGNNIDAVDNNGETAMHGAAYKNLPGVVELLARRGANIKVWNQKNKFGWSPLRIAEGYRFGNLKPSPETIAAFHKVMIAAGVPPVSEQTDGKRIY